MAALPNAPKLLTRQEAAEFLSIRPQTLAVWSTTGRYALPIVKVGRSVRYQLSDLQAFIESRRGTSASAIEAALA
jgi:predicted site-specific integrase-resolvase